MNVKVVYAILSVIGAILPLMFLLTWLSDFGLDFQLFFHHLFSNNLSTALTIDLLLSAIVLLVFILIDGKKRHIPNLWIPLLGTVFIGVSFGLPTYLLMREIKRERSH